MQILKPRNTRGNPASGMHLKRSQMTAVSYWGRRGMKGAWWWILALILRDAGSVDRTRIIEPKRGLTKEPQDEVHLPGGVRYSRSRAGFAPALAPPS